MPEQGSQGLRLWLARQCQEYAGQAMRYQLPTQAVLAERFGCSLRTVARVIQAFVADGDIMAVPGAGMYVRHGYPADSEQRESQSQAQPICSVGYDLMVAALGRGVWSYGDRLPSQRIIAQRLGISREQLRAGFRQLETEKIIQRRGRFWYAGHVSPSSVDRIGLSNDHGQKIAWLIVQSPLARHPYRESFQHIERYTEQRGLRLVERPLSMLRSLLNHEDSWEAQMLPQAVCAVVKNDAQADEISDLVRLLRRHPVLSELRLCCVGARYTAAKETYSECLLHGSIPSQLARLSAQVVGRIGCQHVVCVTKQSATSASFKDFIRVVPELRHRFPHLPYRLQVYGDELQSHDLSSFIAQLAKGQQKAQQYYAGLLNNYAQLSIAEVNQHAGFSQDLNTLELNRGDVVLCHDAASALAVEAHGREQYLQMGVDYALLCWGDSDALRARGIGTLSSDWVATAQVIAHALSGGYPLERTRRGFLRPQISFIPRESVSVAKKTRAV